MFTKRNISIIALVVLLATFGVSCKKKVPPPPPPPPPAAPPPPPPPPPAAPSIAQFAAEPSSIQRGQSSTLRWQVNGQTTNISINQGIGVVQATGNSRVTPTDPTTYTLTATGPGGTTTATATVSVTAPPPPLPPPPPPPPTVTLEDRLREVQDAYFDYDKSDIRGDARDVLTKDADALKSILKDFPNASIVLEGHCDERGSAEYNLGLGDRRATAAKDFLVQLGVPTDKVRTISYGKERPQCTEHDESCWQKNRRAHFSPGQ
ncbi:MAG TPA: peptidoglycan-associated lipoprotein Pal [Bryobacteraceae bacterium]|jgi:peptidoglycan-associated lipoprotein